MGDTWDKVKLEFGLSDEDMFELFNIPYLDDAMSNNKIFHFTQNPIGDTGALGSELKYLKDNGYVFDVATMTASPIE